MFKKCLKISSKYPKGFLNQQRQSTKFLITPRKLIRFEHILLQHKAIGIVPKFKNLHGHPT